MPSNQEHVHLAWPLWSDLMVIPTYGKFGSLVRPLTIFARSCLVDLNQIVLSVEDKLPFLEQPIPAMPVPLVGQDFASFVQNFNMYGMGKTVNELHAMLKLHEETLPKKDANPELLAIRVINKYLDKRHGIWTWNAEGEDKSMAVTA
ncbi:hypothetical protein Tco_0105886 [Tanacetum coccineum]